MLPTHLCCRSIPSKQQFLQSKQYQLVLNKTTVWYSILRMRVLTIALCIHQQKKEGFPSDYVVRLPKHRLR